MLKISEKAQNHKKCQKSQTMLKICKNVKNHRKRRKGKYLQKVWKIMNFTKNAENHQNAKNNQNAKDHRNYWKCQKILILSEMTKLLKNTKNAKQLWKIIKMLKMQKITYVNSQKIPYFFLMTPLICLGDYGFTMAKSDIITKQARTTSNKKPEYLVFCLACFNFTWEWDRNCCGRRS